MVCRADVPSVQIAENPVSRTLVTRQESKYMCVVIGPFDGPDQLDATGFFDRCQPLGVSVENAPLGSFDRVGFLELRAQDPRTEFAQPDTGAGLAPFIGGPSPRSMSWRSVPLSRRRSAPWAKAA